MSASDADINLPAALGLISVEPIAPPGALVGSQAPEPPYWVTFYERDHPANRYTARLGDGPPQPASTGGGTSGDYDIVALPKRSAVTIWRGRLGLLSMPVPLWIGDITGPPLHPADTPLWRMWRPADDTIEPPVVRVRSPGSAVPLQNLDWKVATIEWGDAQGGPHGNRLVQQLTVTLIEYRPDEVLQTQAAAAAAQHFKTYVVRHGDTLTSIARKFKVKRGWQAIGSVQTPPIRDPRKIRVGQRLLIPS